jgi:hypothetical protein
MIVGFHAGYMKAEFVGEYKVWLHDEESRKRIWEEVGRETGRAGIRGRFFEGLRGFWLNRWLILGRRVGLGFVVRRIE